MIKWLTAAGLGVIAVGAIAIGLHSSTNLSASHAQQTKTSNRSADEAAIQANIDQFAKAFNTGDAKAIAGLFSPGGQVESKDGLIAQGREEIAKVFEQMFKEDGKIKIEVSVEAIRFIDTDLAVETGTTKTTSPLEDTPDYDRYTCVHVKRDGKWQMSLARDEEGAEPTAQERLQSLAWLVGDWIDESPEATVMTSCKWSEDKHFLMQDIQVKTGGKPVMMIQQRIGWDPLQKCIHSWVFDSVGQPRGWRPCRRRCRSSRGSQTTGFGRKELITCRIGRVGIAHQSNKRMAFVYRIESLKYWWAVPALQEKHHETSHMGRHRYRDVVSCLCR
jgi:uncharacterized protein (TIGR02246 family)